MAAALTEHLVRGKHTELLCVPSYTWYDVYDGKFTWLDPCCLCSAHQGPTGCLQLTAGQGRVGIGPGSSGTADLPGLMLPGLDRQGALVRCTE